MQTNESEKATERERGRANVMIFISDLYHFHGASSSYLQVNICANKIRLATKASCLNFSSSSMTLIAALIAFKETHTQKDRDRHKARKRDRETEETESERAESRQAKCLLKHKTCRFH